MWTGSGIANGVTTNTSNCGSWSSGAADVTGWYGLSQTTGVYAMRAIYWANDTQTCDTPAPVYCLER